MTTDDTVFVIDDDSVIREQLASLLEEQGIRVECFASGEDFLMHCRWLPRSCAIVDLSLPGLDGMQLQAELARRDILLPVVFLTGHGDIPMSVRAIKGGAFDFLTKPVSGAALLTSVQAALDEGERLYSRTGDMRDRHHASPPSPGLTNRERDVLSLAVEGLTNKAIARRLGISHRTVEVHRTRIMQKTGATSLLELVRLCDSSNSAQN